MEPKSLNKSRRATDHARVDGRKTPRVAALVLTVALFAASCSSSSSTDSQASSAATVSTDAGTDPTTTSTAASDSSTATPPTTETAVSSTTPTATAVTTSTSVAPTTTTAAPTTTTTAPACIDSGPVPADATGFESAFADFDADGLPDQLVTYFSPADNRFRIRFLPGVGGSFDVLITDSNSIGAVRPLGGFDVEGDGNLEAFVVVGSGASATLIGLYDVSGCTISRVTLDGTAASFPVGASIGNISGLACDGDGHIDALFASGVGDGSYEGGFSPHTLLGNVLQQGFGDGAIFGSFEEATGSAGGFDCAPLTL